MTEGQVESLATADGVVQALIRCRVVNFVYSPGSRNAPFAYVLAQLESEGIVSVHPFAEERGGAFWAVGAAKALKGEVPVAVVTTSGTAAAELHPALEEARHQGLPVIAVTADRPFDMVGVGASQTTHQAELLQSSVVASLDIPAGAHQGGIANRVTRTVARALGFGGRPGPVHINVALRDPLVPESMSRIANVSTAPPRFMRPPATTGDRLKPVGGLLKGRGSFVFPETAVVPWSQVVDEELRTVVVAGDVEVAARQAAHSAANAAARRLIPILAEPSSGLTNVKTWIPHEPWMAASLAPRAEQVIVIGKPTLSRPVTVLLSRPDIRKVVVSSHDQWPDLEGNATIVVPALGDDDEEGSPKNAESRRQWLEQWQSAASEIDQLFIRHCEEGVLDHISVAREVWTRTRHADLWLGASNSVRAVDIAASGAGPSAVFASRGLAGIDGNIATAMGIQAARGRPMRALIGDLTFCYDLPTLTARPSADADVQVIVLDDGGGSIFASLEHGAAPPSVYDKYFAVQPVVDVVKVATACGWDSHEITTIADLRSLLDQPIEGRSVVHIRVPSPADQFATLRSEIL